MSWKIGNLMSLQYITYVNTTDLCLVHVIFNMFKLSSNLKSLFSFQFSAEQKSDLKEYKSLLLSFKLYLY